MLSSSSSICGACGATNQPQAELCHICGFAMQPVAAPSMFNSATGQLVSNVTPIPAKQMSVWSFGKRQTVAMLIGFAMVGIVDYAVEAIVPLNQPNAQLTSALIFNITLADLLGALFLVVPLFFSLKFGPWVGLVSSVTGILVGDYLSKYTPFAIVPWYSYVGIAWICLIASFAFLKTRGDYAYRDAVISALFTSVPGLLAYSLILVTGDNASYHENWGATFSAYLPLTIANILVAVALLPIVLRMTNKIRGL